MTDDPITDDLLPAPIEAAVLDEQIAEFTMAPDVPRPEMWMPEDDDAAEWAALRYVQARTAYERLDAEVKEYERRVKEWAKAKRTTGYGLRLRATMDFFDDRLRRYALQVRENAPLDRKGEPLIKRVDLPSARIQTKTVPGHREPGHYEVINQTAAVAWCVANDHTFALRCEVTPALAMSFKAVMDDGRIVSLDGEVIPGIRWIPEVVEDDRVTATVQPTKAALTHHDTREVE